MVPTIKHPNAAWVHGVVMGNIMSGHWMEGDWPENLQPEDLRDVMLKKVSSKIRFVMQCLPHYSLGDLADQQIGELELLADEIDGYYEDDDPRSMGWVGDDGLP